MPEPIFKGPLFPHRSAKPSRPFNASAPIARGVIDEDDFAAMAGRPTRKDLEMQRRRKEGKRDE